LQRNLYQYEMMHLLKALMNAKRQQYPETTKMLAHGVSTQKRKKKQYSFLEDEVKVQHQGLFPYFSRHLFHMEHIPFEKITMQKLTALIPELTFLLQLQQNDALVKVGKVGSLTLTFPISILDDYY